MKQTTRLVLALFLLLGSGTFLKIHADGSGSYTEITMDFTTGKFSPSDLPFDVPLLLKGTVDKDVRTLEISYIELTEGEVIKLCTPDAASSCNCPENCIDIKNCLGWKNHSPCHKLCVQLFPGSQKTAFTAVVPPLKANHHYIFVSTATRNEPADSEKVQIAKTVSDTYLSNLDELYKTNNNLDALIKHFASGENILSLNKEIESSVVRYYSGKGFESVRFSGDEASRADHIRQFVAQNVLEAYVNMRDDIFNVQGGDNTIRSNLDSLRANHTNSTLLANSVALHLNKSTLTILQYFTQNTSEGDFFFYGLSDGNGNFIDATTEKNLLAIPGADISKIRNNLTAAQKLVQDCQLQLTQLIGDPAMATAKASARLTNEQIQQVISQLNLLEEAMGSKNTRLNTLAEDKTALNNLLQNATKNYIPSLSLSSAMFGLTSADFKSRAKWYIVPDLGVAYSSIPGNPGFVTYYGINFNPWPINRDHKFSLIERSTYRSWRGFKNLSVVVGLTTKSFTVESTRISGAINDKALLLGAGVRINDYVRFNTGALLFRQQVNPLLAQKTLYAKPFFSLSIDLDVKQFISDFASLLN